MATTLKLKYNPYTVVTDLELNGDALKSGKLFEKTLKKRLQLWIDPFLKDLQEELNTGVIHIEFEGTELDSEDLKDAINLFNENNPDVAITTDFIIHSVSVDDKVKQLKALFEDAQSGPFEEFRSDEMHSSFNKALAPEFEVNVIATMSSGKSTVINSMLGTELMPSKNEACTATVAKIADYDDMEDFEARRFGHSEELISDWQPANLPLMMEWNSDNSTSTIEVKGDIPAINERDGLRIVLVDTPGPNNSRDASHREATIKAIRGKQPSMVLYILNGTQLSTDDDHTLLNLIKDVMSEGGREAQDRFIFLINRVDDFNPKQESIDQMIQRVRDYLSQNGINNPTLIPCSALLTKLIRLFDDFDEFEQDEVKVKVRKFLHYEDLNLLEHSKSEIGYSTYRKLFEELQDYKDDDNKNKAAEILSGIPIVEALLDNYISKHAIPARLKDAVDSFQTVASRMDAIEKANEIISKGKEELEVITKALETFKSDEGRLEEAKKFRDKVNSLRYKASDTMKKNRVKIDRKFNLLLDNLADEAKEDMKPSKAERLINKYKRNADFLIDEIQEILEENLEKELVGRLDGLRNDYQKYISELLDTSFPENSDMGLVKEFQSATLEMPSVKSLVADATYENEESKWVGTKKVSAAERWKPWTWLKKKEVDVYKTTYEDLVDMSEPLKEFEESLQTAKRQSFQNFEKQAKENLESAKKTILKQMDSIDKRMEQSVKDMKKSLSDKEVKEKAIAENKDKIEWFNNFKSELDNLLSL